jgi:hypothetical protein
MDRWEILAWSRSRARELAGIFGVTLYYRVFGLAGFAAVGGLEEVDAVGAVFGVGTLFVLGVRGGAADLVVLVELDGSTAVFATELGVFVYEGFGDIFSLPEGLVASAWLDAATLDFTLVDFFAELFDFRCH